MRRVLCVWLPTFSTDLVRRQMRRTRRIEQAGPARHGTDLGPACGRPEHPAVDRTPILLTRRIAGRELVVRRCALAASAGVTCGVDISHARSLLASGLVPHVEEHHPERDAQAMHSLACWALRLSPVVAPEHDAIGPERDPVHDGLMIDISGTAGVHGHESGLLRQTALRLYRMGFGARLATAPTFGCAWAVSRFGRHRLSRIPDGRISEALDHLAVESLRIDGRIAAALREIGITQAGQVFRLPRASLAARFGESLVRRIMQALGESGESIDPVRPVPPAEAELLFEGPTDHWESIESGVHHVLAELVDELATRQRGVRRMQVHILRPREPATSFTIDLSRPSRSLTHLWSLARVRLDKVDIGGEMGDGVDGIRMTALRTGRMPHEQATSFALGDAGRLASETAWGELLDSLAGRLGPDRVLGMEMVESHIPEHIWRERSVLEQAGKRKEVPQRRIDRPTRLFSPAEPARAMALTPDGPLLSLAWRGRSHTITACIGPERIGHEWWRRQEGKSPRERDYFAVRTELGRWLWVWRQADSTRWFVHGEWC